MPRRSLRIPTYKCAMATLRTRGADTAMEADDLLGNGNRETECGTLADDRFHRDPATVTFHDLLRDREPDPRARIVLGGMQPLEELEHAVVILRIDPDPVVPDGELPIVPAAHGGDVDA